MLADKKKRKKFSINPQGNIWHHDKSKFGQKLLEKMGWKEGQGLGAQNQGISERIKVPFRLNNCAGFGFKEQEDTLIQQKEFVTLLSAMNNSNPEQPLDNSNVCSLEDKSKKSRARVHYHKFTRGKDLSRYSSKDLVGIFGKQEIAYEGCSNHETLNSFKQEEDDCDNKIEEDDTANLKKNTKKKKKGKQLDEAPMEVTQIDANCELRDPSRYSSKELAGISGERGIKDEVCSKFDSFKRGDDDCELDYELEQGDTANVKKKSKKKKKCKEIDEAPMEVTQIDANCELEMNHSDDDRFKKKTKKRQKTNETYNEISANLVTSDMLSSSKKENRNDEDEKLEENDTVVCKKKTKKKKKDKDLGETTMEITETDDNCKVELNYGDNDASVKKKSKKRQKPMENIETDVNCEVDIPNNNLQTTDTGASKTSKKRQKLDESDNLQSNSCQEEPTEDVQLTNNVAKSENNPIQNETAREVFSNHESFRYSNKRNMKPDVNGFKGSNLPKIAGYACN